MKSLIIVMTCLLLSFSALAQLSPLSVSENTVSLWNFNQDTDNNVLDSAANPLSGTASNTSHLAVPGLPTNFELARSFHDDSSQIDFGPVVGSKLDFTGTSEAVIEAVIHLTSPANSVHIIYSSENILLYVTNNQLAAAIRQPGGLIGVVSDLNLQQNISYRVAMGIKDGKLVLMINGKIDSKVSVEHSIQSPEFSTSRASIGGDAVGRYFPGFIDDVRVTSSTSLDFNDPEIIVVEPATFNIDEIKPSFLINLSDAGTGVNPSSIQVYLNGVIQTGIFRDASKIQGVMDDEMIPGLLNEVRIVVSDIQGNKAEKKFYLGFQSISSREEYQTDSSTLALWHMDDFSAYQMEDSSGNGHHGIADPMMSILNVVDGVFSKGKDFSTMHGNSVIHFEGVKFDKQLTIEAWFQPIENGWSNEILFYNGQVTVTRFDEGKIRVVLHTVDQRFSYESTKILLPLNELHHLAITWNGLESNDNLSFYVDGLREEVFDAESDCDFDIWPQIGVIGNGYLGMIDEMRISNVARTAFGLPTLENETITLISPKNGWSVNEDFPLLHAVLNSSSSINVDSVRVNLNGQLQPPSPDLQITESSIQGKMSSPAISGLNVLEIEFKDTNGNLRKKSHYFFKFAISLASQYSTDDATAGLWHFDQNLNDSSGNEYHFEGNYTPVQGVSGNAQGEEVSINSSIAMNCRSYTVEGLFRVANSSSGSYRVFELMGENSFQFMTLDPSSGNIHFDSYSSHASFSEVLYSKFPTDGAFHHLAVVYDGDREFGNLSILVDGVSWGAFTSKSRCNVKDLSFSLGTSTYLEFDEVRVSRKARYEFNIPFFNPGQKNKPGMNTVNKQRVKVTL